MKESFRAKHNNKSYDNNSLAFNELNNKSKLIRLNEHSYPTNKEKKTKRENLNDLSFHESSRDVRY